MITPAYGITATERVLPNFALDFTTAALDPRITFTRAGNTATVINASGIIVAATTDTPRFDHDPTTLVCKGLLMEASRTNLLLNSLIDGTNLATQVVTVTATAHTLSFYGTGSVALSGASVATVNGLGNYPTRTTLVFTPTLGMLTLTVTGDVKFAQLEIGAYASSFIPTAGSQVTRTSDSAIVSGANFTSWFNSNAGTLQTVASWNNASTALTVAASISDNTINNRINIFRQTNTMRFAYRSGGVGTFADSSLTVNANTVYQAAIGYDNTNARGGFKTYQSDIAGSLPVSPSRLTIGSQTTGTANILDGWVAKINFWPMKLTNAEIQANSQ
jgi:hypothetical protein